VQINVFYVSSRPWRIAYAAASVRLAVLVLVRMFLIPFMLNFYAK